MLDFEIKNEIQTHAHVQTFYHTFLPFYVFLILVVTKIQSHISDFSLFLFLAVSQHALWLNVRYMDANRILAFIP